ncbi:glutamine--tRNA ligase/YqeY domain fusion protein [Buchnera aphidicola]|uniref:Glutamine--tRNA ligase n=1 Tax=Buchnera aphidicola subsp. Cinara cedri (strain Cc) TaxID=372461 RepID=Q057H4_BUCCC|nr:glutamine--tRNA ligase/YqeY domain fusion protein [Buchnera aphidicola]ABJ90725.1 glutaminyl-tRNA synthetase [Buchnera aphidicola BCc]
MKKKRNSNFIINIVKKSLIQNSKKKIKTRFPPEPNGYLHIGHAKSICLNFNIAKKYNGICNLRFDDTNPNKEKIKYINAIKKDIRWLGYKWNGKTKYTSNYFDKMYKYAIKLIEKKLAYVEELNKTDIKKYRGTLKKPGINSPYRNRTVQENLILFNKMKLGMFPEGSLCLRAKIDMSSPYIILRDPVLYRIIFSKHHQTNYKWYIYPMYDFAHCIADTIEKITHSLCTLEFQDNRQLYKWILKKLNFKNKTPKQYEYSKLNLEYTIVSKRKIQKLIDNKIVKGWKDSRLYTISGLRNRGYTKKSINTFCQKIGITKQQNTIEISLLESCIRKELNMNSPRRMAILNPIKVIITNISRKDIKYLNIPNHPQKKEMGTRKVLFSNKIYIEKKDFSEKNITGYRGLILGKRVRLKYSYIIKANKILKDKNNQIICILCTYYSKKKYNNIYKDKNIGIIHWIAKNNSIVADFQLFDTLFTTKNPEKEKNILKFYNPKSFIIKRGYVESIIQKEKIKHAYQFERIGYFYKRKKRKNIEVFNRIVSLKKRYKNN